MRAHQPPCADVSHRCAHAPKSLCALARGTSGSVIRKQRVVQVEHYPQRLLAWHVAQWAWTEIDDLQTSAARARPLDPLPLRARHAYRAHRPPIPPTVRRTGLSPRRASGRSIGSESSARFRMARRTERVRGRAGGQHPVDRIAACDASAARVGGTRTARIGRRWRVDLRHTCSSSPRSIHMM